MYPPATLRHNRAVSVEIVGNTKSIFKKARMAERTSPAVVPLAACAGTGPETEVSSIVSRGASVSSLELLCWRFCDFSVPADDCFFDFFDLFGEPTEGATCAASTDEYPAPRVRFSVPPDRA